MAKYNYHQSAFKNGMLSPKLLGRTDIEEYAYGAKELFNFLPAPMGGAFSRPGTVNQIHSDENCVVISWERVKGTYYIVYTPQALTAVSGGPSDCPFQAYTSEWKTVTTLFSTQALSNWGSATTIGTHDDLIQHQTDGLNELEALDLHGFSFIKTEEYLILTHRDGKIPPLVFFVSNTTTGAITIEHFQFSRKISVANATASFFGSHTLVLAWRGTPYIINQDSSTYFLAAGFAMGTAGTQASSNVTGTLTSYEGNTATVKAFFTADMINTFVVIKQGDKEGVYWIDSLVSSSVVNIRVMVYGLDVTTKSYEWRRQLFAKDLGFPKIVYAFNNRVIYLNTLTKPNWFFASKTNDLREILGFELFQNLAGSPITEASSFELPLNSNDSAEIKWVSQQNDLLIGTGKEEFVVNQGEGALSIKNIGITSQSNIGGSFVTPVKNSEAVFFVGADGRTIRQVQYNFDVRGYRSKNISILNDDLILKLRPSQTYESLASIKIVQIAWQESNRCLWVLTNTDNLFSVTLEPTSQTTAWAYHRIGDEQEVKSIFTFFSNSLQRSILGMITKRGEEYFADFMAPEYLNDSLTVNTIDIGDQPVFMDSCCIIASQDDALSFTARDAAGPLGNPASGVSLIGLAQKINTGKKFEILNITYPNADGPEPTLAATTYIYMINTYDGYGFPQLRYALTLSDALTNTFFTTTKVVELELEDAEPSATYTKWGKFIRLIGDTVDVIADGVLREGLVVDADGFITLPVAAAKVTVGFRFEGLIEPVTPEIGGQFGSAQGSIKRADRVYVRYYKSRTGKIGSRAGNLEPIVFPSTPFTGTIEHYIDSSTDREYSIILKKEQSLPMNIMSVTLRGKSDE